MERNIAVCNHDGQLLQWIDQKRCQRLVNYGRVARVVKTRLGRIRRMAGEWPPSSLSDYDDTRHSFRQHLTDGHRCHRLAALGDNRNDEDNYLAPMQRRRGTGGARDRSGRRPRCIGTHNVLVAPEDAK